MPFAKSGRAEALLHERHPELASRLDRDRQAKIDSIKLHTKYHDVDNWASGSYRGYSFDEDIASPSQQKMRRKSSNHGRPGQPSPALKGKSAVLDLGTSIDENTVLDLGRPALNVPGQDTLRRRPSAAPVGSPLTDVWHDSKGKQVSSANGTPSEHTPAKPIGGLSPQLLPSPGTPSNSNGTPWGPAPSPSPGAKLDLRDIMGQASSSRVSNLSLGIAASRQRSSPDVLSTPATGPKMSQKERKKMQQQQQQQQQSATSSTPGPESASPSTKGSPWQIASGHRVPSLKDVLGGEKQPQRDVSPKPTVSRTSTTPQLTMRQTIANIKPSPSSKPICVRPYVGQTSIARCSSIVPSLSISTSSTYDIIPTITIRINIDIQNLALEAAINSLTTTTSTTANDPLNHQ